jgi:hypothetical protein
MHIIFREAKFQKMTDNLILSEKLKKCQLILTYGQMMSENIRYLKF